MNFMGNEFGHPEWIDFPREGNNWSYKHARRQWSLVDSPDLKYQYLARFDAAMIRLVLANSVMTSGFAQQLNMDEINKTIVFERSGLIFLFNWHTEHSIMDYQFRINEPGEYRILLNSDNPAFGGHGRVDDEIPYFSSFDEEKKTHFLSVYNTNRTALVLKKVGGRR